MNRSFALLGLREDASKDEVKAAYERRLQKYKSSDYEDDPDYVRRKIAELKEAYADAYSRAGTQSIYARDDFDRNTDYSSGNSGSDRRSSGSGAEDSMQKKHAAMHREEDRQRRNQLKKRIEANEKRKDRIEDEEKGSLFSRSDSPEDRSEEKPRTVSYAPARPARKKRAKSGETAKAKGISLAVGIIIVLSGVFMTMCDGSDPFYDYDYDYTDYDDYDGYEGYNYAFTRDLDQQIFDTAMDTADLLFDTGLDDSWGEEYVESSEEEVTEEADRFVQNYMGEKDLDAAVSFLHEEYSDFWADTSYSASEKISQILGFYGFLYPDTAEGYINPYTDEPMTNMAEYLEFLNTYFQKNGLNDDYIS
ncbi:MAG: hypothetical protein ACI4LA_10375 [Emergencia sp.]